MNTTKLTNAKLNSPFSFVFILLTIILGELFSLTVHSSFALESHSTEPNNGQITLQESRPLVARTGAWQTYNDHIHIKPGQEKRPLFLTFFNGADGRAKLTDMQVFLVRKPFATIKDFNGTESFCRDLTGTVAKGDLDLTVKVFGPSGARLIWKLSTEPVIVSSVDPEFFGLANKVTVRGQNFSKNTKENQVLIANKSVQVTTAKSDELVLKLPSQLPGGEQDLFVIADSVKSNAFKVTVKENPKVKFINFLATSPGQPLFISGNYFSRIPSENIVRFGSIKSRVISCSETSIKCIVPDMHFPKWHVPVTVTTNGMTSKEKITINIDQRVIPNLGHPML